MIQTCLVYEDLYFQRKRTHGARPSGTGLKSFVLGQFTPVCSVANGCGTLASLTSWKCGRAD